MALQGPCDVARWAVFWRLAVGPFAAHVEAQTIYTKRATPASGGSRRRGTSTAPFPVCHGPTAGSRRTTTRTTSKPSESPRPEPAPIPRISQARRRQSGQGTRPGQPQQIPASRLAMWAIHLRTN